MQVFDPKQEFSVIERRLPHWSQAGTITFITFRTWDSIPTAVIEKWIAERDAWLVRHGINPTAKNWRLQVTHLGTAAEAELKRIMSDRWNEHLDDCHGECVLQRPPLAEIVAKSLRHFDDERYELTDFVVMPNHVHILAAFPDEAGLLRQCDSWKHFTATQINRALQRKGHFWQDDGFDHLVRSVEQFQYLRKYIAENPRRARLAPGSYVHYTRELTK